MLAAFSTGLIGGLLNSPRCLGMCGGFRLHLAQSSQEGTAVLRQLLFIAGKTFTYVFLGAIAGAPGPWEAIRPLLSDSLEAYPILGVSVHDKRYSQQSGLVKRQYAGTEHGLVRGIGVVPLRLDVRNTPAWTVGQAQKVALPCAVIDAGRPKRRYGLGDYPALPPA